MEPNRAREIADSFKIRCSSFADIMADGKKPGELSVGAKTYCKKWLKQHLYGRREELKSKYIDKGNGTEEEGFTLLASELVKDMVYKNTERRSNDWLEGECDLFHKGKVYDNKSAWSLETFPMFEIEIPDKKYWYQLQGYGILWECYDLVLVYTLNDAPEDMVEQAIKWEIDDDRRYKIVERMIFTSDNFNALKSSYFASSTRDTFKPIPDEERIVSWEFKKDPTIEDKGRAGVIMCRDYIYSLLTMQR